MRGFNSRTSNRYASAGDFLQSAQREVVRSRKYAKKMIPIPRSSSVRVLSVAPHQEATTAAQYYSEGRGRGVMEVNTGKLLKDQRRSNLATLVTHELYGGHHLAAMYAEKQGGRLGNFRASYQSTAFDEGFALYAEQLRDEQGGYKPSERVGYLVGDLWRAARLVVDTGLHTGTMTPAQARAYLKKSAFVSTAVAESEVTRYMDWPGQALTYYTGKLRILTIRKRAKKTLGKNFDAKVFHTRLLSFGSIPLHELERAMASWANRRNAQLSRSKKAIFSLRRRAAASARHSKRSRHSAWPNAKSRPRSTGVKKAARTR